MSADADAARARYDEAMRELEASQAELREAMAALGEAARDRLSLARRIRQDPYTWLGAGVVLGFVIGWRDR